MVEKVTLVLGNGFDLALNLETGYKAFYQYLENEKFIEKHQSNNLIKKIKESVERENWYDFEAIIKEYATSSADAFYLKKLHELKETITEIKQTQNTQIYIVDDFKDIAKEFTESKLTSLQSLNTFIAEDKCSDFNNANELTKLSKQVIDDINAIQKRYKHSADDIIYNLREQLQSFLRKGTKGKQIKYEDNPAIRVLLAVLGIEYKGTKPAAEQTFSLYNSETKEYNFPAGVNIVSFNYTDTLLLISKMLEFYANIALALSFDNLKEKYYPIHGTLKKENIIFGTDNCKNVPSEFFIFKKQEQTEDKQAKAIFFEILCNSDLIVIFGHSINGIDFEYYRDFFKENNGKTPIYIITRDKSSKEMIENVLRNNDLPISSTFLFTASYNEVSEKGKMENFFEMLIKKAEKV